VSDALPWCRWGSVSGISFLGTLLAEQGALAPAARTLRMAVRVSPPGRQPVHTLSMLASLELRLGDRRAALGALRALLGHAPAGGPASAGELWPEYGALAQPLPSPAGGRGWLPPERWDVHGEAAARATLYAQQFPAREACRDRPLLLHSLGDRRSGWGMGSMLHELSAALSLAVRERRTLVLPDDDQWWYAHEDCRPKGFMCYFEALSSCTEGDSRDVLSSAMFSTATQARPTPAVPLQCTAVPCRPRPGFVRPSFARGLAGPSGRTRGETGCDWPGDSGVPRFPQTRSDDTLFVPQEFRARGLLWWRAQLMSLIWRPRPHLLAYVAQRRTALGWPAPPGAGGPPPPVVAMHVRRGDKGGGGRAGRLVVPMSAYIVALDAVQAVPTRPADVSG